MPFNKLTLYAAKSFCILALIVAGIYAFWNPYWSDGDEPHYLVMAESFIEDRDFNLQNNYAAKKYYAYRPTDLELGHVLISPKDGEHRSWHNILLPMLISPGFHLQGRQGARLFLFLFNLFGFWILFKWLREAHKFSKSVSFSTVGAFALTYPIINHTHIIFPDLLAGNFLLTACYFLYRAGTSKYFKYIFHFLAGSVMGLGIFLHYKLILAGSVFYAFYCLWEICQIKIEVNDSNKNHLLVNFLLRFWNQILLYLKQNHMSVFSYSVAWLGFVFLYSYTMYRWFGSWSPNAPFDLVFDGVKTYGNPAVGLLGMLFDANYGMMILAPVLVLIVPGSFLWFKYNRKNFCQIFLPLLCILILQSSYFVWRTWGPSARYLMVFMPLLATSLAYMFRFLSKNISGHFVLTLLLIPTFLSTFSLYFIKNAGFPVPQGGVNLPFEFYASQIPILRFFDFLLLDLYNKNRLDYLFAGLVFVILLVWGLWLGWKPEVVEKNKLG